VLDLIDESLEAWLRATVPLDATDVDVSFEPPERTWSAKLNRPTVNLFLWDIRRSATRSRTGVEHVERDGEPVRRLALPVVELRYVVTAWTSDHGDERALLGGLLRSLLAHPALPGEFLADGLRDVPPPTLLMARSGEEHLDVFKALEGQLKPGINMVVVTPVDTGLERPLAPPVAEIGVRIGDTRGTARSASRRVAGEVLDAAAIGARVHGPRGSARVNAAGRFLVNAQAGDELVLATDPPVTVVVPETGGVRIG
jgi:hypothetical protein